MRKGNGGYQNDDGFWVVVVVIAILILISMGM